MSSSSTILKLWIAINYHEAKSFPLFEKVHSQTGAPWATRVARWPIWHLSEYAVKLLLKIVRVIWWKYIQTYVFTEKISGNIRRKSLLFDAIHSYIHTRCSKNIPELHQIVTSTCYQKKMRRTTTGICVTWTYNFEKK